MAKSLLESGMHSQAGCRTAAGGFLGLESRKRSKPKRFQKAFRNSFIDLTWLGSINALGMQCIV